MHIELRKQIDIIVGGTEKETIVDVTFLSCQLKLLVEGLERGSLRYAVRHVEIGGNTTCSGCPTLAIDIGLGG